MRGNQNASKECRKFTLGLKERTGNGNFKLVKETRGGKIHHEQWKRTTTMDEVGDTAKKGLVFPN